MTSTSRNTNIAVDEQTGWSSGPATERELPEALGRASTQLSTTRTALAPAHALRQMQPGDGLLVHRTLPPAHVRAHPYYSDRRLAHRAALPPSATASGGKTPTRDDAVPTPEPGRVLLHVVRNAS